MNPFVLAIRNLPARGSNNLLKTLSLGVGLAMSAVLVSKVCFEDSYDSYIDHADRTYFVGMNIVRQNEGSHDRFSGVSGGFGPALAAGCPGVEMMSRYTNLCFGSPVRTEAGRTLTASIGLADSTFFDICTRPILVGDARQILSQPMCALVSRTFADAIGGGAVGSTIELLSTPGHPVTVLGVYDDFPTNSSVTTADVILSLGSIGSFLFDGRDRFMGNERYLTLLRLRQGVAKAEADQALADVQRRNLPMELLRENGIEVTFSTVPMLDLRRYRGHDYKHGLLLMFLAMALTLVATFNYILVVISSMVTNARKMAVRKCYGASHSDIFAIVAAESLVYVLLAAALAVVLLVSARTVVEELVGGRYPELFTLRPVLTVSAIAAAVWLICTAVPGAMLSRIRLEYAFRRYSESRRTWNMALLCVQIASASFFVAFTAVAFMQHRFMTTRPVGYEYRNLAYADLHSNGFGGQDMGRLLDVLGRQAHVEAATGAWQLPLHGASGNNVWLSHAPDRELFNVADFYFVGHDYDKALGLRMAKGRWFDEHSAVQTDIDTTFGRYRGQSVEIVVSASFEKKMADVAGWTDGCLGRQVMLSEHGGPFTIVGIVDDMQIGTPDYGVDLRPVVIFSASHHDYDHFLLVRFDNLTPELMQEANSLIASTLRSDAVVLRSYALEYDSLYSDQRHFRDTSMIASILIIVVTLVGLVGYVRNEVLRRSVEIAVRRISGASTASLQRMLSADIMRICIPAVAAGCLAAHVAADRWLSLFVYRIGLTPLIFVAAGVAVAALVQLIAFNYIHRAAHANPVDSLKCE